MFRTKGRVVNRRGGCPIEGRSLNKGRRRYLGGVVFTSWAPGGEFTTQKWGFAGGDRSDQPGVTGMNRRLDVMGCWGSRRIGSYAVGGGLPDWIARGEGRAGVSLRVRKTSQNTVVEG